MRTLFFPLLLSHISSLKITRSFLLAVLIGHSIVLLYVDFFNSSRFTVNLLHKFQNYFRIKKT